MLRPSACLLFHSETWHETPYNDNSAAAGQRPAVGRVLVWVRGCRRSCAAVSPGEVTMHQVQVGIYTAADLADLGIPTEGIEMVMEDQDAEGRARVGAGGW